VREESAIKTSHADTKYTHSVECNREPSDMYLTTVACIGCLVAIFWDNFKPRQIPLASGDILGYISRKYARSFSSYYCLFL